MEYLYSQTNRVLEVDYLMDPDAPDGSDEHLEGDLEYEDLDMYDLKSPPFLELSLKPLQPVQYQAALLQSPSSSLSTSQPDPIVSSTSGPIKDEPTTADQFTPQGISQEDDNVSGVHCYKKKKKVPTLYNKVPFVIVVNKNIFVIGSTLFFSGKVRWA